MFINFCTAEVYTVCTSLLQSPRSMTSVVVMTHLNIQITLVLQWLDLGKKGHVFHIYFKFWMNYSQIQLNLISGFMRNYARWLFLSCHNSICVNISGWNQRQIPNDNFANDFPNRKHREFWQRVGAPSAHNLGINPCYLRRMGLSAHGKYSGQQGLSGPLSLQLIHRSPAHWSLPFLLCKAQLTMAALASWVLLQTCRNGGYRGRVHVLV